MSHTSPADAIATARRIVGSRQQRHAFLLATLAIIAALLALLLIDGLLAYTDSMRWAALLTWLLALLGAFIYVAATRTRREPSLDESARLAEDAIGDPHRHVTAASQLALMDSDLAHRAATALASALSLDDLRTKLPYPERKSLGVTLAVFAAIIVTVGISWPQLWSTTLQRFFAPWADVPPWSATTLILSEVPARARFGVEPRVTISVKGLPAQHLHLMMAALPDGAIQSLPIMAVNNGQWSGVLPPMRGPIRVWATADGGVRSRYHVIGCDPTPSLLLLQATIHQPAYADLADERQETQPNGLLTLKPLTGATLILRPTANLPLASVELVTLDRSDSNRLTMVDGAVTWTTWREGTWRVRLYSVDGIPSDDYPILRIHRRTDQKPDVQFTEPAKDGYVTADMHLPVRIEANDDLGLAAVRVVKSHNHCPAPAITHACAQRRWQHEDALDIASLGVVPGDILTLEAVARDRLPPDGQDSNLARVTLRVIDPQKYNELVRAQLDADALMQKYAPLLQRMAELERRADTLAGKGTSPEAESERAKLHEDIATLRKEVESLHREHPLFASEPQLQKTMIASLTKLDQEVAAGTSPNKPLGAQAAAELAEQLAIARGSADLDLFVALTEQQRAVADDLQRLAAKPEPTDEDFSDQRRLGERQRKLAEALRTWETTAAADAEALRVSQPKAAAQLAALVKAAIDSTADKSMDGAATNANAGKGREAGDQAERAAQALERLLPKAKEASKTLSDAAGNCCSSCSGGNDGDCMSLCMAQLQAMARNSLSRSLFGRGRGVSGASGTGSMVGFGGTDPSEGDRPALYGPETMAAPNARTAAAGRGKDGKGTGDQDSDGNASHAAASYQRAVRGSRAGETVFVSPHEDVLIDEYFRTLDAEEASHVP